MSAFSPSQLKLYVDGADSEAVFASRTIQDGLVFTVTGSHILLHPPTHQPVWLGSFGSQNSRTCTQVY